MAKEYIEREKALNDGRWNSMILFSDTERAREIILCQPAADVVEVVRCVHCKHATLSSIWPPYCDKHKRAVKEDGFCSDGERRDNNAAD